MIQESNHPPQKIVTKNGMDKKRKQEYSNQKGKFEMKQKSIKKHTHLYYYYYFFFTSMLYHPPKHHIKNDHKFSKEFNTSCSL